MIRRPPRSTRNDTLVPYTALFRPPYRRSFLAGARRSGFSRANGEFAVLDLKTKPTSVAGPLGPVTVDDLPSSSTTYWTARRKAEVLAAIDGGLLDFEEACERYRLSRSEERRVGKEGVCTCSFRCKPVHEKKNR